MQESRSKEEEKRRSKVSKEKGEGARQGSAVAPRCGSRSGRPEAKHLAHNASVASLVLNLGCLLNIELCSCSRIVLVSHGHRLGPKRPPPPRPPSPPKPGPP